MPDHRPVATPGFPSPCILLANYFELAGMTITAVVRFERRLRRRCPKAIDWVRCGHDFR